MTVIDLHSISTLEGNPDGSLWSSEFDEKVWSESKRMGQTLETYIENVKGRRIPSEKWLASLVQAFTSVAYKHKRLYNKAEFLSFWRPAIMKENPMLDNITKSLYPNKFDRGIGALRELREQGKVPDIIWKPWTITKYKHTPIGPFAKLSQMMGKLPIYLGIGLAIYVGVPAIKTRWLNV